MSRALREADQRSAALLAWARTVLIELAVVSEGSVQSWEPGRGQPGSRPPVHHVRPSRGDRAPPKDRSLVDHWEWRFDHAADDDALRAEIMLALRDLKEARKSPSPHQELSEDRQRRILKTKGKPEHVALVAKVNTDHVRRLRGENDQDPETGTELPRDRDGRVGYARRLIARGESVAAAARRTGVPRTSLQRNLHD